MPWKAGIGEGFGDDARPNDAEAAAVSGAAMAERRRRALAGEDSPSILVIGSDLSVVAAAGPSIAESEPAGTAIGAPVADLAADDDERSRIELAAGQAVRGAEATLSLSAVAGKPTTAHFMPLREGPGEQGRALVTLVAGGQIESELDELRTRASDLETLSRAARALARINHLDEVGEIVCQAASDVAAADLAVMLEADPTGTELVVSASLGADLVGRSMGLEGGSRGAIAFAEGRQIHAGDLSQASPEDAWPLGHAGAQAAVWQPVRREHGARAVIGVGWCRPNQGLTERLKASLELLAGEAAVAIDRAAALERLTVLARTDPLTDLSNRRAWEDELARELARAGRLGQRLSIGLLDIDELKAFNDRWGHQAGDRLLLTAAARWRRRLRLTDLLARIGGDEFAVTLPACDLAEAERLGDQLRVALPDGLTCSIGVAEWIPGERPESLLERADRALYAAKGAGRNRTVAAPTVAAAGS